MYKEIIELQRDFIDSNISNNYHYRINKLKRLKEVISSNINNINAALLLDLSKDSGESYLTEISQVLIELNYLIKNLKKLMKPKKVKTPLTLKFAKSYTIYEKLGIVLIISPWNYPFLLAMNPLIGAIASGNTVILKPSEYTSNTNKVIIDMLEKVFNNEEVKVIEGSINETTLLLKERFDYIFFTGSTNVGKIIMEAASKHLTPVTLELGGKSPVIIYDKVDVKLAAKKVAFGKLINAGQTCIAPDYLLIKEELLEEFVKWFKFYVLEFYGNDILNNASYPKIININNLNRLNELITDQNIILGGKSLNNKLEPTLIKINDIKNKIMEDEIFGPLLPIYTFKDNIEPINIINSKEKPLVIYLFTNDSKIKKEYQFKTSSGSLVYNDCLVQFSNINLPFGGVGYSGMGKYHGKGTFTTFSHNKAIFDKKRYLDMFVKYHPYTEKKKRIIHRFLK